MKNPTVVFKQPREAVLEDRDIPKPGKGEVLVKTQWTLISTGTELTIFNGQFPKGSAWERYGKFPFVPGYSCMGVVQETGEGVDPAWKNRRVCTGSPHAAWNTVRVNQTPSEIFTVPDSVNGQEAAFFSIAAHIVMNGVRRGKIQWGETVVIYGLGLLGQLAARFAALSGARQVIGIDVSEDRLAMLPQSPSFIPLNGSRTDLVDEIKKINRGRLADVIFEITGSPSLIPREFTLLKPQGRFVMLSSPSGPTSFDFHDLCNSPSITIIGAHVKSTPIHETPDNPWTRERHVEMFFDLLTSGTLNLKPLITHQVPHVDAPILFQTLLTDRSRAMGALIEWK